MTVYKSTLSRKKGMSLLEVLLALTILSISLTGVLSGLVNGQRWFATTREMGQAAAVAQQEIERLRAMEYTAVEALAPQYTFAPNTETELSKHAPVGTVIITSINPNQVQVFSRVVWTDSMGGSRAEELTSLITKNGISKQ